MNTSTTNDTGFSPERLARIRLAMQRYVDDGKLAGIITAIARRDQVVHLECVGNADIAADRPMRPDTLVRIYSMTKPITSVAVLMLLEEARLRLDDPISRYIPAFADTQVLADAKGNDGALVPPTRPIQIRDLLTHTAGLSYGFDPNDYLDGLYRKQLWEQQESLFEKGFEAVINAVAALPLAFQPGTAFRYSFATDVLGFLVQVVSGMPFDAFLKQRIFEPLGMTDTDFFVPAEKIERFAANYGPGDGGSLNVIDAPDTGRFSRPVSFPSGGGGLVSTTNDYLKFAQMLLNKGTGNGNRLLGRKIVEWMAINHLPEGVHPFGDRARGFGLGVSYMLDPGQSATPESVGNFGWGGAANTNFWVDPEEGFTAVFMAQFMPANTYPAVDDFRTLVYQALA